MEILRNFEKCCGSLNKCCFCVDLRIGAIVIAILEIVGGICAFVTRYGKLEANYVAGVASIIAGLCLLFGSIKYHETTTLVYLVLHMLSIVVYAISMFVVIGLVSGTALAKLVLPPTVGIFFTQMLIYIYFWSCVFSFYRGLKSGDVKESDGKSPI